MNLPDFIQSGRFIFFQIKIVVMNYRLAVFAAFFFSHFRSTLRKLALQIIREQNDKLSLKKRRLKAAYEINYLKKLIT